MKKLFLLPLLCCLFLLSCDKSDEPTNGPAVSQQIEGSWMTIEMKYELYNATGQKLAEKKEILYPKFIFESKSVTAFNNEATATTSSYSVSESAGKAYTLIMTIDSLPSRLAITEINKTSMTLRAEESGDTQKLGSNLNEKEIKLATTVHTIQLNKVQASQ